MLTISSGHSADYLLDAVATGRESYYLQSAALGGEPPGRWHGAGAEALGLTGLVDAEVMRSVYAEFLDPRDPDGHRTLGNAPRKYSTAEQLMEKAKDVEPNATPERKEELLALANQQVRNNVAFHDLTFSVQKSVTVLHTSFEAQEVAARAAGDDVTADAWQAHRMAVEEAIWAGNRAMLDYMAQHAGYSRIGHHGGSAGRWTDSHAWTVASFFQHDSREHDPQLHIHNATLNRVQGADGVWRTLDSRSVYAYRGAGAAVAERTTEEHLSRTLGVRFAMRPDGKAREVVGVDQRVMDLFSGRRSQITPKTAGLVADFEARYGRSPNSLQLDKLQRQATMLTRKGKEYAGELRGEQLDRWERELRAAVDGGLAGVAHGVLALAQEPLEPPPFSRTAVAETAVADVQNRQAGWTEGDLVRRYNDALPNYLGGLTGAEVATLLHGGAVDAIASDPVVDLTAVAPGADTLPDSHRLRNGRSSFEEPGRRMYATKEHVRSERALRAAAVERGAECMSPELAEFFCNELAELGLELGFDQRAAVLGVLTDSAKLSALVGPAGSGKSLTVGALAKAWQDPSLWDGVQHRAFGLASSQVATEVLAGDGLETRNVARWLATQDRLASGGTREDDQAWQLAEGDLVLIDESAMAGTADITRIRERVEAAGGKLLLTGDHRQLAAVGAGGGMGLVAGTGMSYELTEARRFAAKWEADASLRLREGDTGALHEYRKHGRIVDGGTVEQAREKATRAYLADTLAGRRALLIADTNEQAAGLSAAVRADLVRLGRVDEAGVPVGKLGATAGVGDVVQARRNAWDLAGFEGNRRGPINREQYKVTEVREDGGLVVDHLGERLVLPGSYAEHVELGYASTVYSAQGLTVDACHTVATGGTGPQGFYVGMTRGRYSNTAYVATVAVPPDSPPGAVHDAVHRDPVAVLGGSLEREVQDRAALEELEVSAAEMGSVRTAAERFAVIAGEETAGRTSSWLDRLTDQGVLTGVERQRLAADQGMSSLATILRQAEVAGHDPEQVLAGAVGERSLDGARSLASVLHDRITHNRAVPLEPKGDSHAEWVPRVADPAIQAHLQDLAQAADRRRDELGALAALEGPQWAVEALGPVPDVEAERGEWQRKAGIVAGHRERTGHTVEGEALPGPPRPGQVEEAASWWASWRALGRPDRDAEEKNLSDGRLRVRVRAWEREKVWQPAYVAHELSGTSQAVERARVDAEIRRAEAAAATDAGERTRLEAEASEAGVRAESLALQARELGRMDNVRASWYGDTANTRAADQRARLELASRGVDVDNPADLTTARELLEAQSLGVEVDDLHRPVTDEHDLTDVTAARTRDAGLFVDRMVESVETNVPDVRDIAEPLVERELGEWTRVPDVAEVTEDVGRAQQALVEQQNRTVLDQRVLEDERDRYVSEPDVVESVTDHPESVDVDQ